MNDKVQLVIALIGNACTILAIIYTTRDRSASKTKEIKTETADTVKTETAQTFQLTAIQKTVDDHECRIRQNEHDIVRHDEKIEGIKGTLDEIKELQTKILERLPASDETLKVIQYGGSKI
jgi:predicted  nucleic acid-binding Zn-ribbon protein